MLSLLALLATSALAAPATFTVDNEATRLFAVVELAPNVIAEVTGSRRHAIRAGAVQGRVTVNEGRLTEVTVSADVKALFPQEGDVLYAIAGKKELTEGEVAFTTECVMHHLAPRDNAQIRFVATDFEGSMPAVKVSGMLTMHGKTKQITVPMDVRRQGEALLATGTFPVSLRDYGLTLPPEQWSVLDQVDVVLDVKLTP